MTGVATPTPVAPAPAPPHAAVRRPVEASKALVAGVAGAVVFLLSARLIVKVSVARCGDGFDGIGCVVFAVRQAEALGFVLSAVAAALLLRLLRARSPLAVAVAGAMSAAALLPMTRELSESLPQAFLVHGVAYAAVFALHSQIHVRREATRLGVTLVAALVTYGLLMPVAQKVDHAGYKERTRAEIERVVTFPVFEAATLPPGYELAYGRLDTFSSYYEFKYRHTADDSTNRRGMIGLKSFPVPSSYRPPATCGFDHPSTQGPSRPLPCQAIGTLPSGETVYSQRESEYGTRATFYVRIGATLVTLAADEQVRPAEALGMLRSLKPAPVERLKGLVGRD